MGGKWYSVNLTRSAITRFKLKLKVTRKSTQTLTVGFTRVRPGLYWVSNGKSMKTRSVYTGLKHDDSLPDSLLEGNSSHFTIDDFRKDTSDQVTFAAQKGEQDV